MECIRQIIKQYADYWFDSNNKNQHVKQCNVNYKVDYGLAPKNTLFFNFSK